MAETETPPAANQSPETIENDDAVSIGEIADAVFEKIKGLIPAASAAGGTEGAGGESAPPATAEPQAAGTTDPPAAPAPPAPAVPGVESVESAVERVLSRRDTDARLAAVEAKVPDPPAPKPQRTGIGAMLFGKDRS